MILKGYSASCLSISGFKWNATQGHPLMFFPYVFYKLKREPEHKHYLINYLSLVVNQDACALVMSKILEGIQKNTSAKKKPSQELGNVSASPPAQTPGFSAGLVIDGRTLEHVLHDSLQNIFLELTEKCRAVVCCRATPLQKSVLVRLVRNKLKAMTLAVGESCGCLLFSEKKQKPVSSLFLLMSVRKFTLQGR